MTKHGTLEAAMRALVGLEKARGAPAERVLILPEDRTKADAMNDVYRALGRPDTADGYGVTVADDAPPVLKGFAGELTKELHPLGASKPVMDKVVEIMNRTAATHIKAENDAVAADEAVINDFLLKEFGGSQENADLARKAVTNLLKDAAGAEFDALAAELQGKLGKSPILFKYLYGQAKARMESTPGPGGDILPKLSGVMSSSEAQAAKNAFMADAAKQEAWRNKNHPLHGQAMAEYSRFNEVIVAGRRRK